MSEPLTLEQQVDLVPQEPGVYLWKDAQGGVLYVGKAKNLRARMRQYTHLEDDRAKIPLLMDEVKSFDYIVVGSEHEALVLEINLIQQYRPRYNVDLKDDKSYPYIAITKQDTYPCIKYTRERHKPGTRYFGPYTDARSARETVDIVRKIVPLCVGTCAEWRHVRRMIEAHPQDEALIPMLCAQSGRPCFDFHVGKGPGVCAGEITPEEYAQNVSQVERFLSGHRGEFVAELKEQMQGAAAELDFERAGRIKRRLDTIQSLDDKQQVVFPSAVDLDLVGIWREETITGACVFLVREGRVVRTCDFILDKGLDVPEDELVSGFLKRYYDSTSDLPQEVNISCEISDAEALEALLSAKRGKKVTLHLPQRGEKAHLMEMAANNARHALMRYKLRTGYDDKRTNEALLQLESALALDEPPTRIECYDISTIHGRFTVASMVVFTAGKPDKSQYRRFKIKTELEEANDVVSMAEVLSRRFSPERLQDQKFGSLPDLLILDGGKPQLNAVRKQLESMGVSVAMCGLAKSDEELFVTWDDAPVVLPSGSASLYLVKQVRDEAHRFAITFHRELRGKAMTVSVLDEVEGIGPKRKRALMRKFGSIKRLKEASVQDIAATDGISEALAQEVYATLRSWEALAQKRQQDDKNLSSDTPSV